MNSKIQFVMFCRACFIVALFTLTSICDAVSINVTSGVMDYRQKSDNQPYKTSVNPQLPVQTSGENTRAGRNTTQAGNTITKTETLVGDTPRHEQKSDLPLPIIIASPAVAVAIVIFICITYRWHSKQLDDEAKQMAMRVAAGVCSSPCLPCRPGRGTQVSSPGSVASPESELFLGTRKKNMSRSSTAESEVFLGARTQSGTGTQATVENEHILVLKNCVSRTQTLPTMTFDTRKGSSWSVLSDQDLLAPESPRRHSTYMV